MKDREVPKEGRLIPLRTLLPLPPPTGKISKILQEKREQEVLERQERARKGESEPEDTLPKRFSPVVPRFTPSLAPIDERTCTGCKKPFSPLGGYHGWLKDSWGHAVPCPLCSRLVVRARGFRKAQRLIPPLVNNRILLNEQNLPWEAEQYSFSSYQGKQEYIEVMQKFVEGRIRNIFLFGPPGRGKSGLAECIIHALNAYGRQGMFMTFEQYLTLLKANFAHNAIPNEIGVIMTQIEVAVIDDVGAGSDTKFAIKEFLNLIDMRLNANIQTIITCNYSIDGLARLWSSHAQKQARVEEDHTDEDSVAVDRIISRLKGKYMLVEIKGRDLRQGE